MLEAAPDRVVRGRPHLVGLQALEEARACRTASPCAARRTCTASRGARRRPSRRRRSGRAARSGRRPPTRARRRRARARRSAPRRESCRRRSRRSGRRRRASARESCDSRSSRSSERSSCTPAKRTTTPRSSREREPRGDVGVVVEPRAEDLVARLQRAPERAREQEVERGHARPERDLVRVALRKRPAAACARSTSSTVRTLVSYGAPMFALSSRR